MHFSGGPVFLGVGIVSGAVTDILRNEDAAGRQIYNPQDTGANIASKTTTRLWKAFTPAAFDTEGRIIKAASGDVSDRRRAYNLANDAIYRLTADFRDDVLAAIGLGKISPKKAEKILKANRIGKEDIAMIRSGRYKKYEPSDAAKKIAPKDRIKAADAAVKRAKDTPL